MVSGIQRGPVSVVILLILTAALQGTAWAQTKTVLAIDTSPAAIITNGDITKEISQMFNDILAATNASATQTDSTQGAATPTTVITPANIPDRVKTTMNPATTTTPPATADTVNSDCPFDQERQLVVVNTNLDAPDTKPDGRCSLREALALLNSQPVEENPQAEQHLMRHLFFDTKALGDQPIVLKGTLRITGSFITMDGGTFDPANQEQTEPEFKEPERFVRLTCEANLGAPPQTVEPMVPGIMPAGGVALTAPLDPTRKTKTKTANVVPAPTTSLCQTLLHVAGDGLEADSAGFNILRNLILVGEPQNPYPTKWAVVFGGPQDPNSETGSAKNNLFEHNQLIHFGQGVMTHANAVSTVLNANLFQHNMLAVWDESSETPTDFMQTNLTKEAGGQQIELADHNIPTPLVTQAVYDTMTGHLFVTGEIKSTTKISPTESLILNAWLSTNGVDLTDHLVVRMPMKDGTNHANILATFQITPEGVLIFEADIDTTWEDRCLEGVQQHLHEPIDGLSVRVNVTAQGQSSEISAPHAINPVVMGDGGTGDAANDGGDRGDGDADTLGDGADGDDGGDTNGAGGADGAADGDADAALVAPTAYDSADNLNNLLSDNNDGGTGDAANDGGDRGDGDADTTGDGDDGDDGGDAADGDGDDGDDSGDADGDAADGDDGGDAADGDGDDGDDSGDTDGDAADGDDGGDAADGDGDDLSVAGVNINAAGLDTGDDAEDGDDADESDGDDDDGSSGLLNAFAAGGCSLTP